MTEPERRPVTIILSEGEAATLASSYALAFAIFAQSIDRSYDKRIMDELISNSISNFRNLYWHHEGEAGNRMTNELARACDETFPIKQHTTITDVDGNTGTIFNRDKLN